MKKIYSFLFLLHLAFSAIGGTFKGTVTDTKGEPLSFAMVFLKGTTIGSSANADGVFTLSVPDGNYEAVAQYMGYKQAVFHLKISGSETVAHHFSLQEEALQMKEFVVKSSEDPALYIMRKVIARRVFHLNQIKSFQTEIYAKGVMRLRSFPKKILGQKLEASDMDLDTSGKGIVNQFEEQATYYTQNGEEKTIIHSVRESGDPNGLGLSQFPEVINFYENKIDISPQITPRGMISPVCESALFYYKYKLIGDYQEGGHTIFKISVTPKRLYEPLFSGTLYIVDDEWGIHSLQLQATATANIQLLDTLTIFQSYIPLKKDEWVIKQQNLFFALKFIGFDFVGNLITVYDNQKINAQMADTLFNKKIVSEYDNQANKKDSAYWSANRPIPLNDEEIRDYLRKDSLRKITEDPKRLDSIRIRGNRFNPAALILNGYEYRGRNNNCVLTTNAIMSGLVNFNTVEGWNVAPQTTWQAKVDSFHFFTGKAALRYGFTNTHFNGIARVNYITNKKDWLGRGWLVGAEAGKYVFQYNPYNPIPPFYASLSALFYRKNYLKIYERWDATAFLNRYFGNGLSIRTQIGYQDRIPLNNSDYFSFAKSDVGGYTPNFPVEFSAFTWEPHHAVIAKIAISYQPGYKFVKYPDYLCPIGSNLPTFTINYEKGIPGILGSKTDFDKWRFSIKHKVNLKLLGSLGYHLATGGFLNTPYVSIPDLNHIQGNQLGVATSYLEGFQVAPYYAFSNKQKLYGEAHLEWQLRGFLTNKIPLFRKLSWYLVAGTNSYYVNKNFYHTEAFVGLDNLGYGIYRFFRVDYVRGWNSLQQPISAIRVGISGNSLLQLTPKNTNTEW